VSPTEAVVVAALLSSQGRVISHAELSDAVWPSGTPSPRALDDLVYRLRRRLEPLRLTIFNSRSRGFSMGVELDHITSSVLNDVALSGDLR
jgi:DNA-binding winged helix-turn-helix (wHTH) protein